MQKGGMMTLEQIADALQDRRLSVVAEATNLTRETLRRFRDGRAKKPEHETVRRLIAYLEAKQ
jgi:rhamnose utilization protein RhaD (predicted bifunctional aldolase and dehydrogenase)